MLSGAAQPYSRSYLSTPISTQTSASFLSLKNVQDAIENIDATIKKIDFFHLRFFNCVNQAVKHLKNYLVYLKDEEQSLKIAEHWSNWVNIQTLSFEAQTKESELEEIEKKLKVLNDSYDVIRPNQETPFSLFVREKKEILSSRKEVLVMEINAEKLNSGASSNINIHA